METNLTGNCEVVGSIPGLTQWVKDLVFTMSCGVSCRCSLDPALLWLCCRPAAVPLTQLLAWEPPYTADVVLKSKKKKKKKANYIVYIVSFVAIKSVAKDQQDRIVWSTGYGW